MAPPKKAHSERRERPRSRQEGRLQEGDEVLIGGASAPAPQQPVILDPVSPDDERAVHIRKFLVGLMEHMNVQAAPEIFITNEGNYKVILQGESLGSIIGRRGETLDAIQQLTSYAVNRGQSKRVRVHVDAEGYRAKREESLQRLAVKVAGKVIKYRRNMTLEPMNAYERHVIHTALQDYKGVTTYSTGVEPNRRTVVAYAPHQK
ncbi:MAG: KH domain-containing protein [Lawsonibacter sp.]|nr:KH domain-containing protein [Lawsonibacter sp.]